MRTVVGALLKGCGGGFIFAMAVNYHNDGLALALGCMIAGNLLL